MKKKTKMLLIQPHSDDILFSASHLLFNDEIDKEVLTIENNVKRVKEDEKLYDFLNIKYSHLNVEFDDQSFYGFHKRYDNVESENSFEYLSEFFGNEKLLEIKKEIVDFIEKYISENKNVVIVLPWGVGHPFHIFVRDVVTEVIKDRMKLWFYRDFPHSYKKRAREQVNEQLKNYYLLISTPVVDFCDVKWDLAKKFYKSQSGLLWFEQGYIAKNLPEDIYVLNV